MEGKPGAKKNFTKVKPGFLKGRKQIEVAVR
jgi:hypothetical protein